MSDSKKFKKHLGYFPQAKVFQHENGSMDLILAERTEEELLPILPNVSVVTITKNRGAFAGLMLYNWINIKYPREKLEWVILDDSDKDFEYQLSDYIPQDDPAINYIRLDEWIPVDKKRNKAVELAKYDFIVHMDDDDYYFPDHVLVKVRLLLEYNKQGVHSLPIGVYDMMERSSFIYDPTVNDKLKRSNNDVAEATLAYRREYWNANKFASADSKGVGEGRAFIGKHFHQWIQVHFIFNMISITHTQNITGHNRRFINENKNVKVGNFEDMFPDGFKLALDNVRKIIKSEYVQPDI
jgi:glycosyltransferase involved in cell wall biosynthesis